MFDLGSSVSANSDFDVRDRISADMGNVNERTKKRKKERKKDLEEKLIRSEKEKETTRKAYHIK